MGAIGDLVTGYCSEKQEDEESLLIFLKHKWRRKWRHRLYWNRSKEKTSTSHDPRLIRRRLDEFHHSPHSFAAHSFTACPAL